MLEEDDKLDLDPQKFDEQVDINEDDDQEEEQLDEYFNIEKGGKRKRGGNDGDDDEDGNQTNVEDIQNIHVDDYNTIYGTDLEEIIVDFSVKVFEDGDEFSVRRFLNEFLGARRRFLSSEVAHIIVTQKYLGSIIKQDDTGEGLGFVTCINLLHHNELQCIHQIKEFILQTAPDDQKSDWEALVNREAVGLLINERLINVPHLIAPQLNETIFEEIEWSVEDGYPFIFEDYIYVVRYGIVDQDDQQPKKKRMKHEEQNFKEDRNYYKVEDDIYLQECYMSFSTQISDFEGRLFIAFKNSSISRIVQQISVKVNEGYSW